MTAFRYSIIISILFFILHIEGGSLKTVGGANDQPVASELKETKQNTNPPQETPSRDAKRLFFQSIPLALLLAFLYGIFVSFTPCVYPMIPITAAILQSQATISGFFNFLLSVTYVLGVALTYASLGLFVALTGGIFGQWLASPWFIAFIIIFFVYLAFAMFGFYEIYIPTFLRSRQTIQTKGSLGYSFIAGIIAGSVASPCLTPALATLLFYVAQQGDPIFGFFVLFSFSFGMGVLLIIIGTSSATLALLPKAGVWLVEIKRIFGFLLLGSCLYIIQFLFPHHVMLFLGGMLVGVAALYYGISGMYECQKKSRMVSIAMPENGEQERYQANGHKRVGCIKITMGALLFLIALLLFAESYFVAQNISLWDTFLQFFHNIFLKKIMR